MENHDFQTTLGEIASFRRGVSYKGSELAKSEADGTPMINMKSFTKEGNYRPEGIKFHNGIIREKYLIKAKDILLANTDLTKQGDILGAAVMLPVDLHGRSVIGSHHVTILTVNDERVNPTYLTRMINSEKIRIEIKRYRRGATVKGIISNDLKKIILQIPPLDEQKRITSILDKTDEIHIQSDDVFQMRDTLIRSVFFEMFGDPASNQNQFPIKPLSECILEIRTGKSLGKEDRELQPNEWGVLKTSAVTWGVFDPTQYKAVPDIDLSRYEQPSRGDLLFTRNNTWELVGATCVVHKKTENLILPDRIWNIVPNPEMANTVFLHYLFRHPYIHALIANTASGTSGSMVNISQPKLKGVKTIIPPICLQNLFNQRVDQINSLFEKIEHANILSSTKSKAIIQEMLT